MRYPFILFDLDGTLLDTNELILQSFEHTLGTFFPGVFKREDLLPFMGEPMNRQFARWAAPEQIPLLTDEYRKYNLSNHDRLVTIFPNVKETLSDLQKMGCKIALVTSKIRLTTERGLRLFDLERYFETLVTIEDTEKHKPEPEPLLLAMKRLGAHPEQTLMVGDSPYDVQGGKAAGTATCSVGWSLRGKEALSSYQPDHIIDDMTELLKIARG
ncbi:pyrophosphatase PpaX [Effusibacillus dendaii]|uniref:Pyrophosphatase PpaX n=1 Tax=Effusibacillus dendaii TaxID=2743772 RepID=A0A7I8DH56_9BACL|nr:pyrophosphatase PpaX [Effusibacillus dendaii]BCJ87930.1 pyrophosphatase PpaX [Effusibacillus dendaii]